MELKAVVLAILIAAALVSFAVWLLLDRWRGQFTEQDIAAHLDRIEQKVADLEREDDGGRSS